MAIPAVLISTAWGAHQRLRAEPVEVRAARGLVRLHAVWRVHAISGGAAAHEPGARVAGRPVPLRIDPGALRLAGLAGTTPFFRNYYTPPFRGLVNAARIDGAGFWTIFVRVVPMSTPS